MFLKVTERKPRIKRIRQQEEPVVINSSDFNG